MASNSPGANTTTALVDYVLSLRLDRVVGLFQNQEVGRGGARTKADLRQRLVEAVDADEITTDAIVAYLDETEPWGRQHVFVLNADSDASQQWRQETVARERLGDLATLIEEPLPLALPEVLPLSSIRLGDDQVEVTAIEARRYTERRDDLDRAGQVEGTPIEYRAYAQRVARGMLILRWDLAGAPASLHITQGEGKYDYVEAQSSFADLLSGALDFDSLFTPRDLRRAVKKLNEREREGNDPLTRSRRYGLESAGGREIDVASPSAGGSVAGEAAVDDAMKSLSDAGRGRLGNVYWLDQGARPANSNPLRSELHTTIVGGESRVHFMRTTSAEEVAYVLGRLRSL